jgi:hypothetical protein
MPLEKKSKSQKIKLRALYSSNSLGSIYRNIKKEKEKEYFRKG